LSILTDTPINAAERRRPAVLTASGIDDAMTNATVTFADSARHTVTVAASTGTVDLDMFVSGVIRSTLTVTDAAGNIASVSGAPIALDTVNGSDQSDRI